MPLTKILGMLSVALFAASVAAADQAPWPQFRGPQSNPVASNPRLPDRWSTTENVEWSAEVPGRGWSSPIVVGDQVLLTTAVTDGASKSPQTGTDFSNDYVAELMKQGLSEDEVIKKVYQRDIEMPDEVTLRYYLYALDLESGKVRWRTEFHNGHPPSGRHRKNSFTSETPVSDGESVYVYVGNLGLFAFDLEGKQRWSTPLEAHKIYLDFGTGASPALYQNQLIVLSDNEEQQFLASFDKASGKELWRTKRDIHGEEPRQSGWSTPFIWENSERTEIVTIGPGVAVSYDLEGRELWRLAGITINPAPSPFVYNGLLYLDGGVSRPLFAVRPGASGDITPADPDQPGEALAWTSPRSGTYITTPVAYDGFVYVLFDKGIIARIDAATGEQSYKARVDVDDNAFTSSPWAYGGKVFCLSETGNTYVLGAGGEFELLHVNPLGEMALATPAIVGDRLLIRTATKMYSIRRPGA